MIGNPLWDRHRSLNVNVHNPDGVCVINVRSRLSITIAVSLIQLCSRCGNSILDPARIENQLRYYPWIYPAFTAVMSSVMKSALPVLAGFV